MQKTFTFITLAILSFITFSCKDNITSNESIVKEGRYKILFASIGDTTFELNTIYSDGTGLHKISGLSGLNVPQWSFDGRYIVYENDSSSPKSIWIMDSTGNSKQKLTEGSQFACSPFSDKLCFIREEYNGNNFAGWAIYSIKMDGTELTRLTDLDYQKLALCWGADSLTLFYTLNDNISGKFYIVNRLDLRNKLSFELFRGYESPQVSDCSKDGSYFLFAANDANVYKCDIPSHNVTQLTNSGFRDEFAKISPLGNKIVFASSRGFNARVFIMDNNGSNQHSISDNAAGAGYPAYSPDGSMIAYVSSEDSKAFQLTICNANEKNKRNLFTSKFIYFQWCPVK